MTDYYFYPKIKLALVLSIFGLGFKGVQMNGVHWYKLSKEIKSGKLSHNVFFTVANTAEEAMENILNDLNKHRDYGLSIHNPFEMPNGPHQTKKLARQHAKKEQEELRSQENKVLL